jgi:anti-sigma-K factor RskA
MTISEYSGPACREIRQLLGVYVVGAIDPAERALVDEHLGVCPQCRDELAGLAGLPAMLSRVPAADVERMSFEPSGLPDMTEPPAELLNSLLRRVAAKRRTRLWRGAVAVAAAAAIAAGAATAATELATSSGTVVAQDVASGSNAQTNVAAVVDYMATPWHGTEMRVQVSGVQPGTTCDFWIVGSNGRAYAAGSWTVTVPYGQKASYTVSSPIRASSVHSFQITSASTGKVLVNIPAT